MKTYLVGGAVRDGLMGIENNDRDYVIVGATPEEVKNLGYSMVGADFPVFLAPNGDQYALARKERKSAAGYLGFEVNFDPTVTLEEDLLRRDLTINAIALDQDTNELIDPYGGVADIENKVLRHVSDAFAEDPLRVIRLARFASRFEGFTVSPNTIILCKNIVQSGELNAISDERYMAELEKMFEQAHDPFVFFQILYQTGAINCLFFTDLFGSGWATQTFMETVKRQCEIVMSANIGGLGRLQHFIAFTSRKNAMMSSQAIGGQIKWLNREIKSISEIAPRDADAVMDILVRNRAFNNTDYSMNELISTISFAERFEKFCKISSKTLRDCMDAAKSVLAVDFIEQYKGAELGSVLYRERLKRVQEVLFGQGDKYEGR